MTGPANNNSKTAKPGATECINVRGVFRYCATEIAQAVGSPWAFAIAVLIVVGWAVTGRAFNYSDTWQLVINTATTIVTFLMVFLIQNTQNRDTKAIQLKLDELLRGVKGARSSLINLENLSDEELDRLQSQFERLRGRATKRESQPAERRTPGLGKLPDAA